MAANSNVDKSTTSFKQILLDCVKEWDWSTKIILVAFATTSIAFAVAEVFHGSRIAFICICLLGAAAQGGTFCLATELIGNVVVETKAAVINVLFGNVPEIFFLSVAFHDHQSDTLMPTLLSSAALNSVLLLGVVVLMLCCKSKGSGSPVSRSTATFYFGWTSVLACLLLANSFIHHRGGQITVSVVAVVLCLGFMIAKSLSKRVDQWLTLAEAEKPREEDEEIAMAVTAAVEGEEGQSPSISNLLTRQGGASILCVTSIFLFAAASVAAYYMQNTLIQTIQDSQHLLAHKDGICWIFGILGNVPEHFSAILLASRGFKKGALQIPVNSSLTVLGLLMPLANIIALSVGQQFSLVDKHFNIYVLFGSALFLALFTVDRRKQTSVGISVSGVVGFFIVLGLTFTSLGAE